MKNKLLILLSVFVLTSATAKAGETEVKGKLNALSDAIDTVPTVDCRPICGNATCCIVVQAKAPMCQIKTTSAEFDPILEEKGAEAIVSDCLSDNPTIFSPDRIVKTAKMSDFNAIAEKHADDTVSPQGCRFCCWSALGKVETKGCGVCWSF